MSVVCSAFGAGAREILSVADIEQAFLLKQQFPDAILIGERQGKKLAGADYGNSPSELDQVNLNGKAIIHTTHAGTQGLVHARRAQRVLCGSFLNASATVSMIRQANPDEVTLVCMGYEAMRRADEDWSCAELFRCLLLGTTPKSMETVRLELQDAPSAARFFDPEQPWSPEKDFWRCLELDKFSFAVSASPVSSGIVALKKEFPAV